MTVLTAAAADHNTLLYKLESGALSARVQLTFMAEYVLDSTRALGARALNVCCRLAERVRVEIGLVIALAARRAGGGANSVDMLLV